MARNEPEQAPPDTRDHEAVNAKTTNPKIAPSQDADGSRPSNQIKDPSDWVTGEEPMTGAQASYLKTLSEEAHEPEAFDPDLDKADASKKIDELKQKTGR